ncbi:hypothetical protein ACVU7I_19085, partial [Patulibacter sp. S7RM1-6]
LPVTLAFPHLGPLALLAYLPARLRLRALAPRTGDGPGDAERIALSVARRLRHEHADIVRERRSRWT